MTNSKFLTCSQYSNSIKGLVSQSALRLAADRFEQPEHAQESVRARPVGGKI